MARKLHTLAVAASFAAGLLVCASPSVGHHSGAMFESQKQITLVGTIKEFQWTNPHSWIQIDAPDEKGAMKEWSVEAGSPNSLSRNGWRRTSFKPGDKVTMIIRPMKDGSPAGIFVGSKLADGSTLGRMPGAPPAVGG